MEKKLSMARNVDFNCTWGVANLVSEISGSLACIRRKMKKKTGIELGVTNDEPVYVVYAWFEIGD